MTRSPDTLAAAGSATQRWRAIHAGAVSARAARNKAWQVALDDGHSVAAIARAAQETRELIHVWKCKRAKAAQTPASPDPS